MSEAALPFPTSDAEAAHTPAVTPVDTFDALYHREFAALLRLATVLVDHGEQAEEVVQEAFAQLYLRWSGVRDPRAYVRATVLNGCRKVLRRRRLARAWRPPAEAPGELGFNHVLDAVRALPPRQRDVVILRYELQLGEAEIARTLGMPVGTVKSTLHRALARLRTEVTS